MKNFFFILSIISLIFIIGCKNDTEEPSNNNKNDGGIDNTWQEDIDDILNVDNPYNYLGILHNEAIDYVNVNTGGEWRELTLEEIKNHVSDFFINYDLNDSLTIEYKDTLENYIECLNGIEFNLDSLINGLEYIGNQALWVTNLFTYYDNAEIDTLNEYVYDSLLAKLDGLEEVIINSNELPEKKKSLLLCWL